MADQKPSTRKIRQRSVPKISDAEWVVMRALWTNAPMTTNEVVNALDDSTHWKPKTIHTLLSRLVRKGALEFERQGREYLFTPRVDAAACEREAAQSFLGRFFFGEIGPFLVRCVELEKLKRSGI